MKGVKRAALRALKVGGALAVARLLTRRGVRILCYHGIWLGGEGFKGDAMFMARETFVRQLNIIDRMGGPVLTLDEVTRALREDRSLPHGATVITIDDGWYSTYSVMLPLLRARSWPATLYVDTRHVIEEGPVAHVMANYLMILARLGHAGTLPKESLEIEALHGRVLADRDAPVAVRLEQVERLAEALRIPLKPYLQNKVFHYMTPQQLAEAYQAGLDVQLHSHDHTLHDFSREAVTREITANRRHLSDVLGASADTFRHFCYPGGRTNGSVGSVLESLGLLGSTTTEAGLAYPGGNCQYLPRILLGENVSDIELEAELCGAQSLMRLGIRRVGR